MVQSRAREQRYSNKCVASSKPPRRDGGMAKPTVGLHRVPVLPTWVPGHTNRAEQSCTTELRQLRHG